MLFSQIEKFDRQELMISLMKSGQSCGQSCFKMETRTRFNLLMSMRCWCRLSWVDDAWMMKPTTKFRIPGTSEHGGQAE